MADGSVVQVLQDGYKELIASKSKKWISGDNELNLSSVETKVKGYNLGLTRFCDKLLPFIMQHKKIEYIEMLAHIKYRRRANSYWIHYIPP